MNIGLSVWLIIVIIVILTIVSIIFKKTIENFINSLLVKFCRIKAIFIENEGYFSKIMPPLPQIHKVGKNDNPMAVHGLFKIKFVTNSVKQETIHSMRIFLRKGNKNINSKGITVSFDKNNLLIYGGNIDVFRIDKSLPVLIYCMASWSVDEIVKNGNNYFVFFSYAIENKVKTIRAKFIVNEFPS